MRPPPWLTAIYHWLAGHDSGVRRHVLLCLVAGLLYTVGLLVLYHAAWLGLVAPPVVHLLMLCMVSTLGVFIGLIRSGWSRRFQDPVLTLPHAMVSLLVMVLAYVMVGDFRADVIILLGQVIAVSMFRLRPRESFFLGLWGVGWLAVAQCGLVWAHTPGFGVERALAHFVVSSVSLLALGLVAMWVSAIRVRILQQSEELRATLLQAQSLATSDVLTGLLNRRSMTEFMESELSRAVRGGQPVCVAIIDLDHFKRVNDLHGHRMGDEVLRGFAAVAVGELRQVDRLARWGGEEFLLLMPHIEQAQAWVAADRLRGRMAVHPLGEEGALTVTISAGIAQWQPGESLEQWLDRADQALYAAKAGGRNQCRLAQPPAAGGRAAPPSAAEPHHPSFTLAGMAVGHASSRGT